MTQESALAAVASATGGQYFSLSGRATGVFDRDPETLAEFGSDLKLSRERVRQIEERALEKLRHSRRSRQLVGSLN